MGRGAIRFPYRSRTASHQSRLETQPRVDSGLDEIYYYDPRTDDMVSPQLDRTEALRREIDHFYGIEHATDRNPAVVTDFAVEIMHPASQSMAGRGRPVELQLTFLQATA